MYVIIALIRSLCGQNIFMKLHRRYATGLIIKLILGKMIRYNAKWDKHFPLVLQGLIYIFDIINYRQIIKRKLVMHMQSRDTLNKKILWNISTRLTWFNVRVIASCRFFEYDSVRAICRILIATIYHGSKINLDAYHVALAAFVPDI